MSRDIRSFFITSKTSESKKNDSLEKKSKTKDKGRSKKRVISSDEDEPIDVSALKNKKAKLSAKQKVVEKAAEVVSPESVFSKKPVKRVNSVSVTKKPSKETSKKASPKKTNSIVEFEDDEFDATLDQLDTSQIEDKYLAHAKTQETSPYFDSDKKSPLKNDKLSSSNHEKNSINKSKSSSPSKSKIEDSSSSKTEVKESPTSGKNKIKDSPATKKNEKTPKSKPKKKGESSKPQIEIEKNTTPKKIKKEKIVDNNDIIEEKIEQKKQRVVMYQSYLNRGGARNPGSKEVPQRNDQCFESMTFLITGVLDSLEREEAEQIIKDHGGKTVSSVSKKLSYLIVGDQAGPSKLAKAESLGINRISEDEFLDLLRTLPPGTDSEKPKDNNKLKRKNSSAQDIDETHGKTKKKKTDEPSVKVKSENRTEISSKKSKSYNDELTDKFKEPKEEKVVVKTEKSNGIGSGNDIAMVEKYRPKSMKQIIGQTGDKSNAKKLYNWLTNWYKNHSKDVKVTKPKYPYKDDTGSIYKAALLSGPPGIGKTTTAYVVCAELGFEVLEFNASDTRSKRLLKDEIASILSNKTVASFMKRDQEKKQKNPKHVLLMDEVDGMAGNEDRGGMQELIAFIKSTEIPIICICNDRQSPKVRSLANYTFDLRFSKPRMEQIKGAMMSICFKEGIKMTPDDLTHIIQSTNQDIRQVINHLAMLSAKTEKMEDVEKKDPKVDKFKNLRLGPWDVIRKVFSKDEHKSMSIHDKSDLFFHDYNIASLFVEENYLFVTPNGPRNEVLDKLASCTDSLATGDTIENCIRSRSAWGLLPVQACFSSVIPGSVMSGFISAQINFPSWLGKNSKRNKCDRLLQDLTVHSRITTGASKESINLDYVKPLVDAIVKPLANDGVDGVEQAIEVMSNYHLTREDLDGLIELTKWPHTRDPMQNVDTKTKTAFTRAYNKTASFTVGGTTKKKPTRDSQDEDLIENDDEQISDNEEDDNIENDKLIKAKASKAKSAPAENKGKAKKTTKNQSKKK